MPSLECVVCGNVRILTDKSYYEAKRLNKTECRSCALKNKAPRGSKYDSLISKGDVFGKRTVISDRVSSDGSWVECRCECGTVSKVRASKLLAGKSRSCKLCCHGIDGVNWRGVGEMPSTVYTKIKLRAQNRNKKFELSKEYLWNLYVNQNKKCALTGMDIDFGIDDSRNLSTYQGSASLDRIDSTVGYVENNVQWVHKHINVMKNEYEESYFKELCKLVVEYGQG